MISKQSFYHVSSIHLSYPHILPMFEIIFNILDYTNLDREQQDKSLTDTLSGTCTLTEV